MVPLRRAHNLHEEPAAAVPDYPDFLEGLQGLKHAYRALQEAQQRSGVAPKLERASRDPRPERVRNARPNVAAARGKPKAARRRRSTEAPTGAEG